MKCNGIILAGILIALTSPAFALDLASARASGAVCEKGDGYIDATQLSAAGLATTVNAGRKAEYERIASQKGQPVDVVAKLAAQQIVAQGNKLCK